MLVYFKVSGFYSFGEQEQIIDFRAKPRTRLLNTKYEHNFNLSNKYKPMKSAIFFGENASGKTNLFLAIKTCVSIIKKGLMVTQEENENFFKNSLNTQCRSIGFGLGISDGDDLFEFFIRFNKEEVLEESLKKNDSKIYVFKKREMEFNQDSNFNSHLELTNEEKKIFSPKNIYGFLNTFFSRKSKESILTKLRDFPMSEIKKFLDLVDKFVIYMTSSYSKDYSMDFTGSKKQYFEENKQTILEILKVIDDSITDFNFKKGKKDTEQKYNIFLKRSNAPFEFQVESEGVKKIIQLMIALTDVVKKDKIVIIDELDSSISTQALIRLFNEFINTEENKAGQLIVSSHNILLFDVAFLNSQQIFIISKNESLCTQVRSFYEYDIRSEKKNAYLDYLKGAYSE